MLATRQHLMQDILPFGTWLREYRRARDLTREVLAQLVGCSIETIRKIESGERRPSKQVARLLAERLDLSATDRQIFVEFARTRAATDTQPVGPDAHEEQPTAIPNNLRAPLTPLIDREREAAAAWHYLLKTPVRLLTLVGPPGVGKTRLGMQVALDLLTSFQDGVFFVPLAQVLDPSQVLDATARVLGLEGGGNEPLVQRLAEHLRDRRMLLVLDNFEQVIAAASQALDLVESCPQLKLLVTSREPLHVRGEQQLAVPPFEAPYLDGPLTASGIACSPAVALFVERAQAVEPEFRLTDANAPSVAAICAQLEGLPLAIELVAARVKMLPPQALLERMSGRGMHAHEHLHLLTGGAHDLPARHRTLREAIGWSYNLLDEQERRLFARLSVFSGGCTLVAIEAVCNPRGDLGASVLDGVASLLDKSLLWRGHGALDKVGESEPRFYMLETVREYADEQLAALGEANGTRRLHLECYLAMAEAADPQLTGADQKSWLDRLERDHDNLRAALDWALHREDVQIAAQIGVALKRFWEVHNHFGEGRRWLREILTRSEGLAPSLKAKVLNAAGALALAQSDYDDAFSLLDGSLELQRDLGDDLGVASALNNLGMVALSINRSEQAIPFFEEGLSLLRKIGDMGRIATMLGNFAMVMNLQGDSDRAVELLNESLVLRRELGNRWGVAAALGNLAEISRAQGNYERAREAYVEAVVLLNDLGDKVGVAKSLVGFAGVEIGRDRPERAARLLGVVEGLLASAGASLTVVDQADYTQLLTKVRSTLDEATLESAWALGRAMDLEEAIQYALRGA